MAVRSIQHDNVREHNRLAVLEALRECKTATRAELARHTGLSVPTVTAIGAELMTLGVVAEGERVPSSAGGRPAQQLHVQADSRTVLAIDLSGTHLRAGRMDLLSQLTPLQLGERGPLLSPGLNDRLLEWVDQRLALDAKSGMTTSALAVAVPGVVDSEEGRVRLAPSLGWSDEPVGEMLREATGLPVLLENDVNAVALGELLRGAAVGRRHVLHLAVANGIGAAMVIGGELFRGANAAAGEIGYSLLPGLPETGLDLGASGPFERHLLGIAAPLLVGGKLSVTGDERAAAFGALVDKVRIMLHNLACMLDPELIVISWAADEHGRLAEAVNERWAAPLSVEIRPGSLGERAALEGVGWLAMEEIVVGVCGLGELEWSTT